MDIDAGIKSFVFNKDVKIRYQEFGEGDTIIFLHGFGGSSYSWRYIYKSFAKNYKTILIDLKGFGLSDKPNDDKYSVSDQADIINSFIRAKKLNKIILVGHSFGGAVVLMTYFKSKMKDEINKLILIDSGGYNQDIPWYISTLKIPLLNNLALSIMPSRFWVNVVLKMCFYDDSKITEEMIETYASYLRSPGAHLALIKTTGQLIPDNIDEITNNFNKINIPVLLVWGKEDKIIPLDIGYKMNKNIPNSKLIIITECGHNSPEEKPLLVIDEISTFLNL